MDKLRKQVETKNKRLSNLKQLETKLAETEVELSSLQESDKVCVWHYMYIVLIAHTSTKSCTRTCTCTCVFIVLLYM